MSSQLRVTLHVVLPWWWRPYLWMLSAFHNSGMIEARPDVAAEFIGRHIKFKVVNAAKT